MAWKEEQDEVPPQKEEGSIDFMKMRGVSRFLEVMGIKVPSITEEYRIGAWKIKVPVIKNGDKSPYYVMKPFHEKLRAVKRRWESLVQGFQAGYESSHAKRGESLRDLLDFARDYKPAVEALESDPRLRVLKRAPVELSELLAVSTSGFAPLAPLLLDPAVCSAQIKFRGDSEVDHVNFGKCALEFALTPGEVVAVNRQIEIETGHSLNAMHPRASVRIDFAHNFPVELVATIHLKGEEGMTITLVKKTLCRIVGVRNHKRANGA